MREESRTEESSEEEEDAYKKNVGESELVCSEAPVSFDRFCFHLDFGLKKTLIQT